MPTLVDGAGDQGVEQVLCIVVRLGTERSVDGAISQFFSDVLEPVEDTGPSRTGSCEVDPELAEAQAQEITPVREPRILLVRSC